MKRNDTPAPNDRATGPARHAEAGGEGARPWLDPSRSPDERAGLVLQELTEDEKFAWLSGPMALPIGDTGIPEGALGSAAYYPAIERLGIPAQQQSDASLGVTNPMGVRPGEEVTGFPSSLILGASFDPDIARLMGEAVGTQAHAKGFNVQLAGGANLIREPRGGRNFEYVSEDPLLTGVIAGRSVAGIQSRNVVSTVKHFAINPEETGRVMVSSDISEAALRESDLLAFQIAIEIGRPGAVMPGYNLVNGDHASENAFLLNTVLKGDWHYPGWVMADWGATHSTGKAIMAGLDVQSGANIDPEPFFAEPLREAVAQGRVPQGRIDESLRRQLRSLFAVGAVDHPARPGGPIDFEAHRRIARQVAEEGIVLLKNEGGLLPLSAGRSILVVGPNADKGVLTGGGSSAVQPLGSVAMPGVDVMGLKMEKVYQPSPPLRAIAEQAGSGRVEFRDGLDVAAAVKAAREHDIVVVCAEEWRSESLDAQGLDLPDGQDALIAALAEANPRTVVVVQSGGPVAMPWLGATPAVLAAFYPGSSGGDAIARILFGAANPSGRLPVTFPRNEKQLPRPDQRDPDKTTSNPGSPPKGGICHVDYDIEGSDVGYRWFLREGLTPLFPFGHGLSYTHFTQEAFAVRRDADRLLASVTVRNEGDRAGAEVVQVYAEREGPGGFARRLAGFGKIRFAPGEAGQVEIAIDARLLARFDTKERCWRLAAGTYRFVLARNAMDGIAEVVLDIPETTRRA